MMRKRKRTSITLCRLALYDVEADNLSALQLHLSGAQAWSACINNGGYNNNTYKNRNACLASRCQVPLMQVSSLQTGMFSTSHVSRFNCDL